MCHIDEKHYYGDNRLPTPAREYIDYYAYNPDACVGIVWVNNRWSTVHASGRTKSVSRIWSFVPHRYISFNKKGICFALRR
jgi:hypothetical protein